MYIGHTIPERPIAFEDFDPDFLANYVRENVLPKMEGRRRVICQNFVDHATAECKGDYDTLMSTCSKKAQDYRRWGDGSDGKMEGIQPSSYEELERFYGDLVLYNLFVIHLELEKLCVDEDCLFVEGNVHQLYHGSMIPVAFGIEADDLDEDAVYMLTIRMALCFIFDEDGMGTGEQSYTNGDPVWEKHFVKMPNEHVPQRFWDNLEKQRKLMEG